MTLQLPASTAVNRFVPKEKFYSKTAVNYAMRQLFTSEIEKIVWTNKIAPDTLNIAAGEYAELQVFEITLKGQTLSPSVLKHIDTFIPYPILFILKRPDAVKSAISFKESSSKGQNQMKVDSYYETGWQQNLELELKGRSVDEIYMNFVYQIAPALRQSKQPSLKSTVETNRIREALQKQIEGIGRKIANEPSVAKRQDLARERYELEQQIKTVV